MSRRILIRDRHVGSDVSKLEQMIQDDFKAIWKDHIEDLEEIGADVVSQAQEMVPIKTGVLRDSIDYKVSKSHRYPGLMVYATAKHRGYDYALVQETDETYSHVALDDQNIGVEQTAHFLGGPFARDLRDYYADITGEELDLPDELQHAIDYIEDKGY